jgi:lysophospholipase L1-like esterase
VTHPLVSRPSLTLVCLAALVALPYALPKSLPYVTHLRLLQPREDATPAPVAQTPVPEVGEATIGATDDGAGTPAEPVAPGGKAGLPFAKPAAPVDAKPLLDGPPPRSIEDPSGKALDPFYAMLDRVEKKEPGAIARIVYYGDSVIASDWITATLRRKLQARFGDSGHGFLLVADAWPGYHHDNVARYASKGWKVSRVVGPYAPDGLYGLGGVSFLADGPGMYATVSTATSGDFGRSVSKFVVTYAEQPGGGKLSLKLDDKEAEVFSTAAETTTVKTKEIRAEDGPHKLEIRSNGGGGVRVFHVVLERDTPGVVVDAVGIIGCRLRFLDKIDDAHWKEELQRRNPSLIAFTYGANESGDGFAYPMDKYEESARAVLKQAREALPNAACLLVGPLDAADKKGDSYQTRPVIPAMNEIQRKLAAELGCGFFDTWSAMGGYGSMGVWIQRGLGGADLVHPTSVGAEVLGGWVNKALMEGYSKWQSKPR